MDALRLLRLSKGLTMKQLGELTDVSESTIGMIETGKRKPSYELLLKLSEVFDCSLDDLVYGKKIPITESDGYKSNMVIDLSALDQEQIQLIQDVLELNAQSRSVALPVVESLLSSQKVQDDQ